MDSDIVLLNCWLYHDDVNSVFPVEIPHAKTVGVLKEAIRDKIFPTRRDKDARQIMLYNILVSEDVDTYLRNWTPKDKNQLNGRIKLSKLFSVDDEREWIVIVYAPTFVESVEMSTADMALNCWVHGEKLHSVFTVEISSTKTLAALKKAIKAERPDIFGAVNATKIRLYHVPNCTGDNLEETTSRIDFDEPLMGGTSLPSILPEAPLRDHIQIIVGNPSGDKPTTSVEVEEQDDDLTALVERFERTLTFPPKTPSEAAKSTEYAKIQAGRHRILDCRYSAKVPVNTVAPPIQLFNPAFAYFSSKAFDPAYIVPDDFVNDIRELVAKFTQIYDLEKTRREEIRSSMSTAIRSVLSSVTNSDGTSPDFVVLGSDGAMPKFLVVEEEKNEFGDGGSDPSTQASFSYRNLFSQPENVKQSRRSCFPAFIIAHAGPWLSVMGGIVTDYCIVQRLTDFVWVPIRSTNDDDQFFRIARILYALRESIQRLDSWYRELKADPYNGSAVFHPRFWPSPIAYKDDATNAIVRFAYHKPLERDVSCVTFLAKTWGDNPKDIVVKFVTSYGADVHRHMASKGFAPRLLYHGKINVTADMPSYGKLRMVVMEYVKGSTLHDVLGKRPLPSRFKQDLEHAFEHLRDGGYVYGDLRTPNIIVLGDSKRTAQLIDFDWAGKAGEAKYPVSISSSIRWPKGVKGLVLITKEHDKAMLDALMSPGLV